MTHERFYPKEENLGKDCEFWQGLEAHAAQRLENIATGCIFPKFEMAGRVSCEGVIDDVCLYLKNGRKPKSLTPEQLAEIKYRIPDGDNRDLPPGNAE